MEMSWCAIGIFTKTSETAFAEGEKEFLLGWVLSRKVLNHFP